MVRPTTFAKNNLVIVLIFPGPEHILIATFYCMRKILVDFHALFAECRFGNVMYTETRCSRMRKSWRSLRGQTINSSHLVP